VPGKAAVDNAILAVGLGTVAFWAAGGRATPLPCFGVFYFVLVCFGVFRFEGRCEMRKGTSNIELRTLNIEGVRVCVLL